METGAHGASLGSAPAPVVEELSFAHATVTIRGRTLHGHCTSPFIVPNSAEALNLY